MTKNKPYTAEQDTGDLPIGPRPGKSAAILVGCNSVSAVASFTLIIILARNIPKSEFGGLQWIFLLTMTLASIGNLGLPQTFALLVPRLEYERIRMFITGSITFLSFIGLVIGVAVTIFGLLSPATILTGLPSEALLPASILPWLYLLTYAIPLILIAYGMPTNAGILVIVYSILNLTLGGSAAILTGSATITLQVITFGYAIAVLFGVVVLIRSRLLFFGSLPTLKEFWPHIKYALPLWGTCFLGDISKKLDGFLVAIFFTPVIFAVFTIGAREIPLVGVLAYSVTQAIAPKISRLTYSMTHDQALVLWHRAMEKTALIIFPVFAFLVVSANDLIVLIFSDEYRMSTFVFIIYLILLPVRITGYGAILTALGRTSSVFNGVVIGTVINIPLSILLLFIVGWTGPAIATVLSQLSMVVYYLHVIKDEFKVNWLSILPYRKLSLIAFCTIIPTLSEMVLVSNISSIIYGLLFSSLLFSTLYITISWKLKVLQAADVKYLLDLLKKK